MDSPCIVVGVDLSPTSRGAAEAAVHWAKDSGASVVLVHAFGPIPRPAMLAEMYSDTVNSLQEEMSLGDAVELTTAWAERIRLEGVDVDVVAEETDAARLLLRVGKERNAAMIVVGNHGHGALARFILGSVATDVVHKADRPVLVVPDTMGEA